MSYADSLKRGNLSTQYVDELIVALEERVDVRPLPANLLGDRRFGEGVAGSVRRLPLHAVLKPRSWAGLVVGFPGTVEDLKAENLGTPFVRLLLYPLLELQRRLTLHLGRPLPCLYIAGVRFPEVVLRKFRLLGSLVRSPVVLTRDLLSGIRQDVRGVGRSGPATEAAIQRSLCRAMETPGGLEVGTGRDRYSLGYVSYEVPTFQGSSHPERLDILGLDRSSGSLVAFELKRAGAGRAELENLFLQGWEHRSWLEENKRAIKLLYEGPSGRRINTRKRARLLLGLDADTVPDLFWRLRREALRADRHLRVDFVRVRSGEVSGPLNCFAESVDSDFRSPSS